MNELLAKIPKFIWSVLIGLLFIWLCAFLFTAERWWLGLAALGTAIAFFILGNFIYDKYDK